MGIIPNTLRNDFREKESVLTFYGQQTVRKPSWTYCQSWVARRSVRRCIWWGGVSRSARCLSGLQRHRGCWRQRETRRPPGREKEQHTALKRTKLTEHGVPGRDTGVVRAPSIARGGVARPMRCGGRIGGCYVTGAAQNRLWGALILSGSTERVGLSEVCCLTDLPLSGT